MPWLWIGTWSLGGIGYGRSDERESRAMLEKAYESGIRHFDTAGFYANGRSEKIIQKALGSKRRSVFISTKGGIAWEGKKVIHCGSYNGLKQTLHKSLEILKTDYIDLFQLHWPDPNIPLKESLNALKKFKEQGLIRFWGVGNLSAEEINHWIEPKAFIPHQVHFNPLHRADDILWAGNKEHRCYNCVTSPLEQGLLTNSKSSKGLSVIGKNDVRRRNPHFHSNKDQQWLKTYQVLTKSSPMPRVSLILLWILTFKPVDVVIPGPRTSDQLDEILEHLSWLERLKKHATDLSELCDLRAQLEEKTGVELWNLLENRI